MSKVITRDDDRTGYFMRFMDESLFIDSFHEIYKWNLKVINEDLKEYNKV